MVAYEQISSLDDFDQPNKIRTFESGADRDVDDDKLGYEGAISPLVWREFAIYMKSKTTRNDGTKRSADNWQRGFPLDSYMESMFRHFMDVWLAHRGWTSDPDETMEALMALLFNVQGYAHELLKET